MEQWLESTRSHDCIGAYPANYEQIICTAAARWGADQELEACVEWIAKQDWTWTSAQLRAARRPKAAELEGAGAGSI